MHKNKISLFVGCLKVVLNKSVFFFLNLWGEIFFFFFLFVLLMQCTQCTQLKEQFDNQGNTLICGAERRSLISLKYAFTAAFIRSTVQHSSFSLKSALVIL